MTDRETTLAELRDKVQTFVAERDWAQFHNAKDLAAAIAIEAAELMEPFLWLAPDEVEAALLQEDRRRHVGHELADVIILCLSLANTMRFDLSTIVTEKIAINAGKYPVDKARGSAKKYTELQ